MKKIAAIAIAVFMVGTNAYAQSGLNADGLPQGVMCEIKKVTLLAKNEADCKKAGGKVMFIIETEKEEKK